MDASEFHRSTKQNAAFHARCTQWAEAFLKAKGKKITKLQLNKQKDEMKTAAKLLAYMTGEPRYSRILLHDGGSSGLKWHDFREMMDLMEMEFPRIFGVEPEPAPRDSKWDAEA